MLTVATKTRRLWTAATPVIVDPFVDFGKEDVVQAARKAARTQGLAQAAVPFLQACSTLPVDHPLHIDSSCLFLDKDTSPVGRALADALIMVDASAMFASKKKNTTPRGKAFWGKAFCGEPGVGKSQLLRMIAAVPSLIVDNVIGLYYDAGAALATTPVDMLRVALARRLQDPALNVSRYDLEKLCTLASAKGLAIVTCVDRASDAYRTHTAWTQFHSLLQWHNSRLFLADGTTVLPILVRGTDQDIIQQELGLGPAQHGLDMAVSALPCLTTRREYESYLVHRQLPKDIDLAAIHRVTIGRLRSLNNYFAHVQKTAPVPPLDLE